jgi:hypothetical protein
MDEIGIGMAINSSILLAGYLTFNHAELYIANSSVNFLLSLPLPLPVFNSRLRTPPHCKPSPFDKQFCMANTAVFISYITFQSYQKKIFQSRQMQIFDILICSFRQDYNFYFGNCSLASPTSVFAFPDST